MKKMLKTMISAICAVTMLASTNISVNAEYADFDTTDYYYGVFKLCEYDESNQNLFRYGDKAIDTTTEEFKAYLKNAKKNKDDKYVNENIGKDKWYLLPFNVLGTDNNGNVIVVDSVCEGQLSFDENNNPVFISDGSVIEPSPQLCGYAITKGELQDIRMCVNRILVNIDDNGEAEIRPQNDNFICKIAEITENEYISKIFDYSSNKYFLLRETISDTYKCEILNKGDANLDTQIDIKDVAKYAKHIVKIDEIPEYADIVSDIDGNGSTDLKDLTTLKSYLIGEKDSL